MNTPILLTLNLLEDSILLNEGVLDALDWPRQVQIMINKDEKMLLLRACTIDDQQAVVVPEERTVQFEISGQEPAAQDSSPGRLGRRPPEALLW